MSPEDLLRVTNHSFRAGGATDCFVGGLSAEFIKAQGGWKTYCFRIYVRPAAQHRWRVAAQLMASVSRSRVGVHELADEPEASRRAEATAGDDAELGSRAAAAMRRARGSH